MRYSEISKISEAIAKPLSNDLLYDKHTHKLRTVRKPVLRLQRTGAASGEIIEVPNQPAKLFLKDLHRIRHVRQKYLRDKRRSDGVKNLMYKSTGTGEDDFNQAAKNLSSVNQSAMNHLKNLI